MTTDNPYKPPTTEISENVGAESIGGTLQDGIKGNYDFLIMDVIGEAWQKTDGVKVTLFGAFLVYWIISLIVTLVLDFVFGIIMDFHGFDNTVAIILSQLAYQLLFIAILFPFLAGIQMVGVRRSVDLPVSFSMVFGYFGYTLPIVIAAILMTILAMSGLFLWIGFWYVFTMPLMLSILIVIIPGLYFSFAYLLTIPLIVEKNLEPWQAMEASRKAITHHWFKVFFTYLIMGIVMVIIMIFGTFIFGMGFGYMLNSDFSMGIIPVIIISVIILGLSLFWTMLMMVNVGGILYRIIFGVEEAGLH